MNEVDRMFKNNIDNTIGFIKNYFEYLSQVLEKIDKKEIEQFIEILIKARIDKSTIFFIGNGGSAATASHFANDISIGTRTLSKPFRAISLCDNAAVVTAIANDDGYEEVFVQQLIIKTYFFWGYIAYSDSLSIYSTIHIKMLSSYR